MRKLITFVSILCLSIVFSSNTIAQQLHTPVQFELVGTGYNGKKIDLRELKGKTILISFYSAGCAVCARDLKLMREFYRDNNHKNFILIGVNLDKTKAEFDLYTQIVSAGIPKNQQFPMMWSGNAESIRGFGALSTDPIHFLIHADGNLSLKREGTLKAEDWDNLWELLHL